MQQYDMQQMRPEAMKELIAKQFMAILCLQPSDPDDRAAMRREVAQLRFLYELTIEKIRSMAAMFNDEALAWQGELAIAGILLLLAQVELATWEACQHGRPIDLYKMMLSTPMLGPGKLDFGGTKGGK